MAKKMTMKNNKKQTFTKEFLRELHKHSFQNEEEIRNSKKCGCFFCMEIYHTDAEIDMFGDSGKRTAVCPYCGIDSVLGDACGVEITPKLLKCMNKIWF